MNRFCLALGLFAIAAQLFGQTQPLKPPARAEAERAIRTALHDLTVSTFTADIKGVRSHTAQRTLGLYDLLFDVLTEVPAAKDQLSKAGVRSGADFFSSSLKSAVATQKVDPEQLAKKNADTATIEFRSGTEALVEIPNGGSWRAVWEGNAWKLDSTASAKQSLLASPMVLRLQASQRKRLEDY